MPFNKPQLLSLVFVLALFLPGQIKAAEIRLDTEQLEVKTGQEFTLDVIMSSDIPLNAVEGQLKFSSDLLQFKRTLNGGSQVSFWIDDPHFEAPDRVVFAGVTPGGFQGNNYYLFSVVFEAVQSGMAMIKIEAAQALQNDGAGTATDLNFKDLTVSITEGDGQLEPEVTVDEAIPEAFTPLVSQDADVFEGEPFIVFSTQDKGSGVLRYEVRESRWGLLAFLSPWRSASSPYKLSDSELKSWIVIRAVDHTGNIRTAELPPKYSLRWHENPVYWVIIGASLALLMLLASQVWRRRV